MAILRGPEITKEGLLFAWNGLSPRSWDGSSTTHTDLVGGKTGTKTGAGALSLTNNAVFFTGTGNTRTCYLDFPNANVTVPTGDQGSWIWAQYFQDAGNQDHPNFGKETGSGWDGQNGFVFGTGWGSDGPRWGIGGTAYQIYSTTGGSTGDYRTNVWQMYAVTYERGVTNGLKTYLHDSNGQRLVDQRTPSNVAIGSNTNDLHIGATNSRGGNWHGNMDFVLMYATTLSEEAVFKNFDAYKSRYGL